MRPPAPSARLSHQLRRQSCTYHTRDRPPGKASEPVLDELKFLADSATITIEPKHLDPFVVCDRRNFIALTNHDDVFSVNLESTTFTATSRKFFAIRANDCYSTEHRQADAELDAEAHEYFSILNAAMADPATLQHYFWYLMHTDLTDWVPGSFPKSTLMLEIERSANAVWSWYSAWRFGDWAPPAEDPPPSYSAQFPSDGTPPPAAASPLAYRSDSFFPSTDLLECFRLWALDQCPPAASITKKQFELRLAVVARGSRGALIGPDVRRRIAGRQHAGYCTGPAPAASSSTSQAQTPTPWDGRSQSS